jgi:hypothetical protein
MAANPVDAHRRQMEHELKDGNAAEHTHRPTLKTLIEALDSGVTAPNEPKQVECGAPDFLISLANLSPPQLTLKPVLTGRSQFFISLLNQFSGSGSVTAASPEEMSRAAHACITIAPTRLEPFG